MTKKEWELYSHLRRSGKPEHDTDVETSNKLIARGLVIVVSRWVYNGKAHRLIEATK